MPRLKFKYNPKTCQYEHIEPSFGNFFIKALKILSLAVLTAGTGAYLFITNYDLPDEVDLASANESLQFKVELKAIDIAEISKGLERLQMRDDEIYRIILEADAIPQSIRTQGIGGKFRYEYIYQTALPNKESVIASLAALNKIKRQLYLQSLSYDEIESLVKEKENFWASLPGIQPIPNKNLDRLSTTFGMRMHPILNVMRPHRGLDFMAPHHTPVYTTGDGIVLHARYSPSFGNVVEIDHGYGYQTRYAHLTDFNVEEGEKVKRGECIGFVGNSGLSVSDHLHYEVLLNGQQVNPIYYFQRELDDEDYEELIELSKRETIPLD